MESAKRVVPLLLEYITPKSVVEVGCGKGEWLREFQGAGARILGLDDEKYGQTDFWLGNKEAFQPVNMEKVRITCSSKFDLAVCLEVAHRYTENRAKDFVHDLCLLSDVVLFSAAIPGQEEGALNGQLPSYWQKIFRQNGFMMLDCIRPRIWEEEGIGCQYSQNLVMYVRREVLAKIPSLLKFYISTEDGQLLEDAVHPKNWVAKLEELEKIKAKLEDIESRNELSILLNKARKSFKEKPRVAILCNQKVLDDIFECIDMSSIEICAIFGDIENISEQLSDEIKKNSFPLEECFERIPKLIIDYYITVIPYGSMMSKYYPYFAKIGIGKERILNISAYFGVERNVGLMYYYQWKYLLKEKPELDYIVTGASATKMGFDLNVMKPLRGIKLLTNAQDLYYQYKVAKAYFERCMLVNHSIKYAMIELTPNSMFNLLNNNAHYFNDIYYFPILSHADTEYYNTERGNFMERVLTDKSIKWLDKKCEDIKGFNWNDRDGQCGYMNLMKVSNMSESAKENAIKYVHNQHRSEEIFDFNTYVLEQYVNLCEHYHVIPIILIYPYSDRMKNGYPNNVKKKFLTLLDKFHSRIHVIDLWKLHIPEEFTSDLFHLNAKGAKIVTEAIKSYVNKLEATTV